VKRRSGLKGIALRRQSAWNIIPGLQRTVDQSRRQRIRIGIDASSAPAPEDTVSLRSLGEDRQTAVH
jgi:hypothetical protein